MPDDTPDPTSAPSAEPKRATIEWLRWYAAPEQWSTLGPEDDYRIFGRLWLSDLRNAVREYDALAARLASLPEDRGDRGLELARDAWRDYAEHAAGCVECGATSWENCSDGKDLRQAAEQADKIAARPSEETR